MDVFGCFQVELVSPSKDFHKCYVYVLDVVRQSKVTRVEVLFERCIKYWQGNKWHAQIVFWELGWILSCFALVSYLSFLYIDMNSKQAID
jgi:hypothetical protein